MRVSSSSKSTMRNEIGSVGDDRGRNSGSYDDWGTDRSTSRDKDVLARHFWFIFLASIPSLLYWQWYKCKSFTPVSPHRRSRGETRNSRYPCSRSPQVEECLDVTGKYLDFFGCISWPVFIANTSKNIARLSTASRITNNVDGFKDY